MVNLFLVFIMLKDLVEPNELLRSSSGQILCFLIQSQALIVVTHKGANLYHVFQWRNLVCVNIV